MVSLKWIIGLLSLGLAELLLVIQLHEWFDTKMMVIIYLATTLLGYIFLKIMERHIFAKLYTQAPNFSNKAQKKLDKKIKNAQVLTGDEQLHFKLMMGTMFFTFAWVLIVMPGLITDFIGIILVIPGMLNKLLDKAMIAHNQLALKKNSVSEPKVN